MECKNGSCIFALTNSAAALDLLSPVDPVYQKSCECNDGFELVIEGSNFVCQTINEDYEGSVELSEGSSEFPDSSFLSDDEDDLSTMEDEISMPMIEMKSSKVVFEQRYCFLIMNSWKNTVCHIIYMI